MLLLRATVRFLRPNVGAQTVVHGGPLLGENGFGYGEQGFFWGGDFLPTLLPSTPNTTRNGGD